MELLQVNCVGQSTLPHAVWLKTNIPCPCLSSCAPQLAAGVPSLFLVVLMLLCNWLCFKLTQLSSHASLSWYFCIQTLRWYIGDTALVHPWTSVVLSSSTLDGKWWALSFIYTQIFQLFVFPIMTWFLRHYYCSHVPPQREHVCWVFLQRVRRQTMWKKSKI